MTLGGGLFQVNFQLSEYMGQPCQGSDGICKGAISSILIILHVLASLVLLLRHAASQSPQCLFLSRRFRIPDQNRVNQVGL